MLFRAKMACWFHGLLCIHCQHNSKCTNGHRCRAEPQNLALIEDVTSAATKKKHLVCSAYQSPWMTDKENQGYPELQNMQIWGQSKTWALLPCPTKFQKTHLHCLCDTKKLPRASTDLGMYNSQLSWGGVFLNLEPVRKNNSFDPSS